MIAQDRPPVEGIVLIRHDRALREFCRDCLKQQGFRAIEAEDGFEAVLIAASRARPVDLFITDVENGRISGIDLEAMLQSISRQIKVLCLTGSVEKKRQSVATEIIGMRKAALAGASQLTKVVVTGR